MAKNKLSMFTDIQSILDQALASGGGDLELPTNGQAVKWRHRAYQFRKLYRESLPEGVNSPYDRLIIPQVDSTSAVVRIRPQQAPGIFKPLDGTPIVRQDDPLLDEAMEFAKRLGDVV